MATRTWKHGLWLGLIGFSMAAGCVVKSSDDDDDIGGAGEGGDSSGGTSSGGTAGRGGSSGSSTGGRGGSSGSNTGGSATGGSATGGSATGGSSGAAGANTDPECDPGSGQLDNTPFPNCEPRAGDDCDACIQESCCEESRICYGYDPGNVCGWGGPTSGDYEGASEIDCYRLCAQDYVAVNGVYDDEAVDTCTSECVTPMCGDFIGNATQDLVICMEANCEERCFWPPET
jgi:hypothetical protein